MSDYWNDGTSLYHYGILGQRWGIRRFQNPDGTLTEEGKRRYRNTVANAKAKAEKRIPEINKIRDIVAKQGVKRKEAEDSLNNKWNDFVKLYPGLKRDVGHWTQVDDPDLLEMVLDDYGAKQSDTKKFLSELKEYQKFLYKNDGPASESRFIEDANRLEARVNDILARTKKKNMTIKDIKEFEKFLNEEFKIGNVKILNM